MSFLICIIKQCLFFKFQVTFGTFSMDEQMLLEDGSAVIMPSIPSPVNVQRGGGGSKLNSPRASQTTVRLGIGEDNVEPAVSAQSIPPALDETNFPPLSTKRTASSPLKALVSYMFVEFKKYFSNST